MKNIKSDKEMEKGGWSFSFPDLKEGYKLEMAQYRGSTQTVYRLVKIGE